MKHLSSRTKTKKFDYTDGQALALRHRIEKEYFSDAGIPTHFISAENLDTHVIANLQALYTRAHQPTSLSADNRPAFECRIRDIIVPRSEEHTSELQSLMRISYAVF